MYGYEWTDEYGIFRLTINARIQKEIRPVFHEELDFFGMDEYWDYPKDTDAPILWAEGVRRYVLNGRCVAEAEGGGFYNKPNIIRLTDERLKLNAVDVDRLYEVNEKNMISIEQKAIQFIQDQHEKYLLKKYAFICAFSGGKDSLLLLDLISKALAPTDFYVVFSNTGMELSDTLKAVDRAKTRWKELRFEEAKSHLEPEESWDEFGPPASRLRWCCAVHKSVPTVLHIQKLLGKNSNVVVFDGVRGEESLRRSKYEEVGEGVKNSQQVNCHAILKWSSSEVFVYLLKNRILLNDAYRLGIYRVGCKVCPMSAKWQDSLIAANYPEEISVPLRQLEEITLYAKGRLDKKYIEDGGWQSRAGGRILKQGENRVQEQIDENVLELTIVHAKQDWLDVLPIFGDVVENSGNRYKVHTKHGVFDIQLNTENDNQTVSVSPVTRLDRVAFASLRAIANKTAYCIGCKSCVPQCPVGAFQIIDGKINIRQSKCIHCYNCCFAFDRGCMVAKSLHVRGDNVANPDKYRNFGFRRDFYSHFCENGPQCFNMDSLGKDQYKSLKQWLAEAGVLQKTQKGSKETISTNLTELGEKLINYGEYNPFPWAIMWANLAYNSIVVNCFCLNVDVGATFDSAYLVDCLDHDVGEKYRRQAVNSLLSTFRDSPIGDAIYQGVYIEKNIYMRSGWDYPNAVVLLYALYLYAEKTGRHSFTFSELVNAHSNPNSLGISPADIYGIDVKSYRDMVQGLAIQFPKYIRVSFVANLDNIILENYTSLDILDLAEE